jgi:hypothetical protein
MQNTRLYQMLLLLDLQERAKFDQWTIQQGLSPLPSRLAHTLLKSMETAPAQTPDKKELWEAIKPNEPFNAAYFKNLVSDVQASLRQFMLWDYLNHQTQASELLFIELLIQRGASYDLLSLMWRAAYQESLSKAELHADPGFMRRLWDLAMEIARRNPDRKDRFRNEAQTANWPQPIIVALPAALDEEYLVAKLRLACEALVSGRAMETPPQQMTIPLDHLLEHLKGASVPQTPLLKLYLSCHALLATGQGYPEFRQALQNAHIPVQNLFELTIYVQNHCIWRSNEGDRNFLGDYLYWMDFRNQRGIQFLNGQMPPSELKNYVTASLKLGQTLRAKNFLSQYAHCIPLALREKATAFNVAHIAYAEGDMVQARKLLATHPVLDQFDELDWRSLQLKIHCALVQRGDEAESLFGFIHSFRNFLYRCKALTQPRIKSHLRRLNYVERAFKNPNPRKIQKLRDQLAADLEVPDREWLLGVMT